MSILHITSPARFITHDNHILKTHINGVTLNSRRCAVERMNHNTKFSRSETRSAFYSCTIERRPYTYFAAQKRLPPRPAHATNIATVVTISTGYRYSVRATLH